MKFFLIYIVYLIPLTLFAQNDSKIITIHENFNKDPQWEGVNNRVECNDCPTVNQDFGWTLTNKTGDGPGETQ